MAKRDFLTVTDFTTAELQATLDLAVTLKREKHEGRLRQAMAGRVLALIFHKPSLRTRVSFEAGMQRLGGSALYITDREIGMGTREAISDVGEVLSRYVDAIMIRTFSHKWVEDLAAAASVPVINGLTDDFHPCQIVADLLTVKENFDTLEGKRIVFVGDGNNVLKSWVNAARRLPIHLTLSCPEGFEPDPAFLEQAKPELGDRFVIEHDPHAAVRDADVIYTDVWASMGQEAEAEARKAKFVPYQVNGALAAAATRNPIILHCLPAHRGEEITDEVIDGPRSRVFDQAENRMHAQNAILVQLLGGGLR